MRINPITRKRWSRFRKVRRAICSLYLLIGLYGISLVSELICNDKPLYVRFEGASYFPIFQYYQDDLFTGSGKKTRADYKAINRSPNFAESSINFMIFPPVPYGPFEIISTESLPIPRNVTVEFYPEPPVGTVNIRRDFTIAKANSVAYFFGIADSEVRSTNLEAAWQMPKNLSAAIETRFKNEAAEHINAVVASTGDAERVANIALSTFKPRSRPPKTVRLTFRDANAGESDRQNLVFNEQLEIAGVAPSFWNSLSADSRALVVESVADRFTRVLDPIQLSIAGTNYEVRFEKQEIQWPFRPVAGHWLGIDNAGRDVLARILYGLRISMTFGFLLVSFSMIVGIVVGAIQGFYGGVIDITSQRLVEIWSALPFLYVMILLGSVYGRSFALLLFVYGIFNWIGISYYVRAEFLKLRRQPFVESAVCSGIPAVKIIFRHILPNALTPVITFFPFSLVGAIGALAALDYLGFGLPPPTPSWGELLAQAQQFRWAWWLILYPSAALFLVMLLGVFIGEGVREAFDPRKLTRIK